MKKNKISPPRGSEQAKRPKHGFLEAVLGVCYTLYMQIGYYDERLKRNLL